MSPSIAKYLTIYTKHSNFVFNILLSSLRIILAFIFLSPIFKRLDFIIYSQLILFICRNYIKATSKMLDMHCIYKVKVVLDNYYTNIRIDHRENFIFLIRFLNYSIQNIYISRYLRTYYLDVTPTGLTQTMHLCYHF